MKTFEDFQVAFPKLYRNVDCGFSCPPGWVEVVWRLSEQLEPLGIECRQVKEKFGGLRFYTRGAWSEQAAALIRAAEDEADHSCELCGQPGTLGKWTEHWVRTLCPEHTPKDVPQDVPPVLKGESWVSKP